VPFLQGACMTHSHREYTGVHFRLQQREPVVESCVASENPHHRRQTRSHCGRSDSEKSGGLMLGQIKIPLFTPALGFFDLLQAFEPVAAFEFQSGEAWPTGFNLASDIFFTDRQTP
jgi:hypothetical protein